MSKKYDRAKTVSAQLYDIIDDFTDEDGRLLRTHPLKNGNFASLVGEIEYIMEEAAAAGEIYDFRLGEDTFIDDVNYSTGYIAVSWMEDKLNMCVFQWEEV